MAVPNLYLTTVKTSNWEKRIRWKADKFSRMPSNTIKTGHPSSLSEQRNPFASVGEKGEMDLY
ncbi:hypothetical protein Alg130_10185 [Pyrenophora tritici-repentis]|nr:hypothetical protein Alg130_10185 [Pyrenophora tritici-repentis]